MVRTLSVKADIPANRELDLHVSFPSDVPLGPAEITLVVSSPVMSKPSTLGDLLDSEFFGMWRDRTDIPNSIDHASKLRSQSWKRSAP